MNRIVKGVGLYSGGLDSMLAIKLILDQGIHVAALVCRSPFFGENTVHDIPFWEGYEHLRFHDLDITDRFLKMLSKPKYGYGKNLNPCIDCKILMLREAKSFMKKTDADFVFTGEVLGQRPMSQRRDTLRLVEKEFGLEGRLLRPLSAKLLPATLPEISGLIDRERLLDLSGRSRKRQIEMARRLNLDQYPTPGGGCLLTDAGYSNRLRSFLKKGIKRPDILKWLRIGRHFDMPCGSRLIVGRNHIENTSILSMAQPEEILIKTTIIPGPVAVILGCPSDETKRLAAMIMAGYSDYKTGEEVEVAFGKAAVFDQKLMILPLAKKQTEGYKV